MAKKRNDYIDELNKSAALGAGRQKQYGSCYKKIGAIMKAFFPEGVVLETPEDMARYERFSQCVGKLNRYSESMESGGHKDSAVDLINYAAMLAEDTDA